MEMCCYSTVLEELESELFANEDGNEENSDLTRSLSLPKRTLNHESDHNRHAHRQMSTEENHATRERTLSETKAEVSGHDRDDKLIIKHKTKFNIKHTLCTMYVTWTIV
jgi:hypothetical protein